MVLLLSRASSPIGWRRVSTYRCVLISEATSDIYRLSAQACLSAQTVYIRGGLGNQDTAISGNSAPTDRARRPGKQKDHEQETAPQSLVDLQGQGGLGRHSRREDPCRAGQAARRAPQPDQRLEEPVARARCQRVRRRIGGGAAGGPEGAARQDRSARLGE